MSPLFYHTFSLYLYLFIYPKQLDCFFSLVSPLFYPTFSLYLSMSISLYLYLIFIFKTIRWFLLSTLYPLFYPTFSLYISISLYLLINQSVSFLSYILSSILSSLSISISLYLYLSILSFYSNQSASFFSLLYPLFFHVLLRYHLYLRFPSIPLLYHLSTLDGSVYTSSREVGHNTGARRGDVVEMEVNLKSQDRSQRTLHWFVNGVQQKIFITGVPDRVEFAVCCSSLLISLIRSLPLYHSSDKQRTARRRDFICESLTFE